MYNIKLLIKKVPFVDRLLKDGYYGIRRIIETYMLGTKMQRGMAIEKASLLFPRKWRRF